MWPRQAPRSSESPVHIQVMSVEETVGKMLVLDYLCGIEVQPGRLVAAAGPHRYPPVSGPIDAVKHTQIAALKQTVFPSVYNCQVFTRRHCTTVYCPAVLYVLALFSLLVQQYEVRPWLWWEGSGGWPPLRISSLNSEEPDEVVQCFLLVMPLSVSSSLRLFKILLYESNLSHLNQTKTNFSKEKN